MARTSKSSARASKQDGIDAIELLRQDHDEVDHLFQEFEHASTEQKKDIATQICNELTVHAQIEEEIFYPAVKELLRGAREDKELVPEAEVEHSAVKNLIAEVEGLEPEDELFEARVKVMSEYVRHHVKEEQEKIFPKVSGRIDTMELGRQLSERKAELMEAVSA